MPALSLQPTPLPQLIRRQVSSFNSTATSAPTISVASASAVAESDVADAQSKQACVMEGDCEGTLASSLYGGEASGLKVASATGTTSGSTSTTSALSASSTSSLSKSYSGLGETADIAICAVLAFIVVGLVPAFLLIRRWRRQRAAMPPKNFDAVPQDDSARLLDRGTREEAEEEDEDEMKEIRRTFGADEGEFWTRGRWIPCADFGRPQDLEMRGVRVIRDTRQATTIDLSQCKTAFPMPLLDLAASKPAVACLRAAFGGVMGTKWGKALSPSLSHHLPVTVTLILAPRPTHIVTLRMATIHSLPLECLFLILELAHPPLPIDPPDDAEYATILSDLHSASLVCQSWRTAAQSAMWLRLHISSEKHMSLILESPCLGRFRTEEVRIWTGRGTLWMDWNKVFGRLVESLKGLKAMEVERFMLKGDTDEGCGWIGSDNLKVEPEMGAQESRRLRSAAPAVQVKLESQVEPEPALTPKVEEFEAKVPQEAIAHVKPFLISVDYDWPAHRILDKMQGYWLIEWEDSTVSAAQLEYWKAGVRARDEADAAGQYFVKWWPSWELKSGTGSTLVAEWKARVKAGLA
ncbi:hypothetical protein P7C70_g7348, partial [Phenoliferia sp. Uapishka_3]